MARCRYSERGEPGRKKGCGARVAERHPKALGVRPRQSDHGDAEVTAG